MSKYPEIASNKVKEVEGVKYFVRKFGFNNVVIEEELTPIPKEKIIRTMNIDGTEDVTKQKTETIKL